jgi:hypothetical protein
VKASTEATAWKRSRSNLRSSMRCNRRRSGPNATAMTSAATPVPTAERPPMASATVRATAAKMAARRMVRSPHASVRLMSRSTS